MNFKFSGACSCQSIRVAFHSNHELAYHNPRQCDCDYCAKHNIPILLSDHEGQISIRQNNRLHIEHQGAGLADMLLCENCGDMIGARIKHGGQWIGALNARLLDQCNQLPSATIVSPKLLPPEEKLARWSQLWSPLSID